jgi:ABC-2 type transport system ATP-binding protein
MPVVIAAEQLTKSYGRKRAVDGVTFSVPSGQILSIVGPNGAGKTTTVEICEGLRRPDAGSVKILGLDPRASRVKERIGVQLEESAFERDMKVAEIFQVYGSFYRRARKVEEVLSELALADKAGTRYGNLSKGWKQRVSIGVAMIHDPDILFFDELSSGLDPEARLKIWDILYALKMRGKTIVLTTHYMEEAESLGDVILIIHQGRVLKQDRPEHLLGQFISRHKVEYWGAPVPGLTGMKGRRVSGNRVTVFADDPEEIVSQLCDPARFTNVRVAAVGLEDVYLYYTGEETPKD